MPGFNIQGIGGKGIYGNDNVDIYPKYAWELPKIFNKQVNAIGNDSLIYVKSSTLPKFKVEIKTVAGASSKYKHAKAVDWEPIRITWYDNVGLLPHIRAWRKSVWSHETGLNIPNIYKKDTSIHVFNSDRTKSVIWNLIQSWPASIGYGEVSYTDSEVKQVDIEVVYDWAFDDEQDVVEV